MKQKTKFKQTEIGEIPEGWDVETIQDLPIDIIDGDRGKNYPKKNEFEKQGFCLFLNTKNVPGEHFDLSECDFISEERDQLLRKGKLQRGDIVLTTRGTVGNVAYYHKRIPCEHIRINSGMVIVRNSEKRFDTNYLYQVLKSSLAKEQYLSFATGSAQPQLPIRDINKIRLAIPLILEQRAIAKILSNLDDKIELNQQMNKTLEAIGQTLFKRWFVDFEFPFDFAQGKPNEKGKPYKSSGGEMADSELGEIPKGWGVGKFCNIVTNIKEALNPGNHLFDRRYVPIDSLPMNHIGMIEDKPYVEAKSSLIAFEKNDILFGAMRAYFHRVNLAPFKGVTRTTTFVLRPNKEHYLSYGLFLLNQDSSVSYANLHSKGSTMPYAVWDNSLAAMPVFVPDEVTLKVYHNLIYPLLQRIAEISDENKKLSNIRDSLLPRLMSGRIRAK